MNDSNELNIDELLTMLEEMQDQNDSLREQLEAEQKMNSEAQEGTLRLSSENSLLRNTLQQKSETIVSLNEKIGMLQDSDKVLEENERLQKEVSDLTDQNTRIKKKSEVEVAAAKKAAEDKIEALAQREGHVSFEIDRLAKRHAELDKEVDDLAGKKVSGFTKAMKKEYDVLTDHALKRYNRVTKAYRTAFIVSVLYEIITTVITGLTNKYLTEDVVDSIYTAKDAAVCLMINIISIGRFVASFADKIHHPLAAAITHWILFILIVSILAGVCIVIPLLSGIRYVRYIKKKQADVITAFFGLMILAAGVYAGEVIKQFWSVNLLVFMAVSFLMYSFIRGIMQMENEEIRNKILEIGIVVAGTIISSVFWVYWHCR